MNRRTFLAGTAAGVAFGLTGCASAPTGGSRAADETPVRTPTGVGSAGADLPVPARELRRGAPQDAIPAITEPAFGQDWEDVEIAIWSVPLDDVITVDLALQPADPVVGVERDGEARAYPLRLLNYHEVVNDDIGGPLLVTYCPLCRSAIVARRTVGGAPTTFGVSGLLYRANLVLYDAATESLWSQLLARAIRGPVTGASLELVPSTVTTWGSWRATYPDTRVLLPPPASGTVRGRGHDVVQDYTLDPYAGYSGNERIGINPNATGDARLHPKELVLGVAHRNAATAYSFAAVSEDGVVNDTVGDLPVVVAAPDDATLVAYVRDVDGDAVAFDRRDEHLVGAGSRWVTATGTAVDGPHAGETLRPATKRGAMFWFAWADLHPETTVYG